MKTIATIILVCFGVSMSLGQNQLKLSIKQGSDSPNYEKEHMYLMELTNSTKTVSSVNITTKNIDCSNVNKSQQIEFNQLLLEKNQQSKIQQFVIQPGKTVEFYVKLSQPQNARLDTWNCTEVVAESSDGKAMSNSVTIESLVPNPNNNN